METFLVMCNDHNLIKKDYGIDDFQEVAESFMGYYFLIKPALFRVLEQ
jgi:5'(3')-deoxyribonucleotidase